MNDSSSLSPFQESLVRSAFEGDVEIVRARHLQVMRPCPLLVELIVDRKETDVILRIARNNGGVEREASIYPALRDLGLPMPKILAGPMRDPHAPELFAMMLIERLKGRTVLEWAENSEEGLDLAGKMLIEAYTRFRQATVKAEDSLDLAILPRRSIRDDLQDVIGKSDGWMRLTEIQGVVALLQKAAEGVEERLMLSNGDFSPSNFLSDGTSLTGMIDFEKAAFVDPLMILTRIPVYDVRPFAEAGIIGRIVAENGYSPRDFALRVAVFCLRTLQTKVPLEDPGGIHEAVRKHVMGVLKAAMTQLS